MSGEAISSSQSILISTIILIISTYQHLNIMLNNTNCKTNYIHDKHNHYNGCKVDTHTTDMHA